MKRILSIVALVCVFVQIGRAQCFVDAGDDIHVCASFQTGFSPTVIGEGIVITNATAPYIYEWSIAPVSSFNTTLYASDFLNDTSIADPTVLEIWEDSLTFFLKLEDADQQVCYDTIIVSASLFISHLGTFLFTINAGDSVLLFGGSNISSNYPTDSLVWRPSIGLSDSTVTTPMASPPSDQHYGCAIWDSQGCYQEGSPFQYVIVTPVGVEDNEKPSSFNIHSSNNELHLYAEANSLPYVFELWDGQGTLVLKEEIKTETDRISTKALGKGVYIYSIRTKDARLQSGKLVLFLP